MIFGCDVDDDFGCDVDDDDDEYHDDVMILMINRFLDSKGAALLSTTIPNTIKTFLNDDFTNNNINNNNNSRGMSLHDVNLRVPSFHNPSQDIRTLNLDMAQQHHQQYQHTHLSQQNTQKLDFLTGRNGYKTSFPWIDQGKLFDDYV